MLHVYFGNNRHQVRDKVADFLHTNMPPDGTMTTYDAVEYQTGQITDALGATSLFGGEQWYIVDTPSLHQDCLDEVLAHVTEMTDSQNVFIIIEGALSAPLKKQFSKSATSVDETIEQKTTDYNRFAMTDALISRDRRQLWILIQEARRQGVQVVEIVGLLWWQFKTLRLAESTSSAEEAGMKEYPYKKAKHALRAFKPGEIIELSHRLLELYHEGYGDHADLDLALERWVLAGR